MIIENINRLDRELKSLFDTVAITKGSERTGHHFDITAEKVVEGKRVKVTARVPMPAMEMPRVKWSYLSDPRDSMSHVVEMVSDMEELAADINEVAERRRLDRSYLESLSAIDDPQEPEPAEDEVSEMVALVDKLGMQVTDTRVTTEDGLMVEVSTFKGSIRESDRQRIDMALSMVEGATHMWIGDRLVVKQII
jgi:hypothetical protein